MQRDRGSSPRNRKPTFRRNALRCLLPALLLASPLTQAASIQKPNIVVILADDLGYGDVLSNNPDRGKIPTPHIDRLAAGGMHFTDGHSSSGVCSPSRYALLTGRYHWRSKLQSGIVGRFAAPLITPDRFTIAQGSGAKGKNDTAQPVQLYNLAEDLGETKNLAAEQPECVAQMQALLEKLIADGRSPPGAIQANDVEVKRF